MQNKKELLLLFQHPLEPIFLVKDGDRAIFADQRDTYIARSNQQDKGPTSRVKRDMNNFGDDCKFAECIGRGQMFSVFFEKHGDVAARLIELLMQIESLSEFFSKVVSLRDRLNANMFQYVLSVVLQHRKDTKDLVIPNIVQIFPTLFIDPSVLNLCRERAKVFCVSEGKTHVEIPENFTASLFEEEQALAYFREDVGINIHHWHWHLVYPIRGPMNVIDKDRRGELFYYMHHQIQARYNVERFCNGLTQVQPLRDLDEPIAEGYFPKLLNSSNNRTYPGRAQGSVLKDYNRDGKTIELEDLNRWRDRIYEAIDDGYVEDTEKNRIPLDKVKGIDILGNIVEASDLSINNRRYGSLHNEAHNLISCCHDPDHRHLENPGVMAEPTTAMRDPIFYRLHAFIDSVFQRFKQTLPAYTNEELAFAGVKVNSIELKIQKQDAVPNTLLTYKQKSHIDLSTGIDFGEKGNVFAHFTHLQHDSFVYQIKVMNTTNSSRMGSVRIFLCPRTDDRGQTFKFNKAQQLMIEMDKFTYNFQPGQNTITQTSEKSSVTIPYNQTFRTFGPNNQPKDPKLLAEYQMCGCGWPQHMLLPRGSKEGTIYDVFVMISDFADDEVAQIKKKDGTCIKCDNAHSFCGLKDQLYPDKRAMGFPFDRVHPAAKTLKDFIKSYPNMKTQEITIKYTDVVVDKKTKTTKS